MDRYNHYTYLLEIMLTKLIYGVKRDLRGILYEGDYSDSG